MAEDIRPEPAIHAAKKWLAEVYVGEAIDRIGLEEVRFRDGNWEITLGFNRSLAASRPIDDPGPANPLASVLRSVSSQSRIYKIVVVAGNDNRVIEMREREVA